MPTSLLMRQSAAELTGLTVLMAFSDDSPHTTLVFTDHSFAVIETITDHGEKLAHLAHKPRDIKEVLTVGELMEAGLINQAQADAITIEAAEKVLSDATFKADVLRRNQDRLVAAAKQHRDSALARIASRTNK